MLLIFFICLISSVNSFSSVTHRHCRIALLSSQATTLTEGTADVWWKDGLNFKCTGCGKCCQNEGEVWLDVDEFSDLCSSLKMPHKEVMERYVDRVKGNWIMLKSKGDDANPLTTSPSSSSASQCVFLDADGKQCTIYEARPAQCRTYPYWPRLLASPEAYNEEVVLPEGEGGVNAKHWSPESGGCEGINNPANATIVSARTIYRNLELYNAYIDSFPFMENGNDEERFLANADLITALERSTRAWVNGFVVKYDLCPFARQVFQSELVRYRVFLGSNLQQLKQKIRYEVCSVEVVITVYCTYLCGTV